MHRQFAAESAANRASMLAFAARVVLMLQPGFSCRVGVPVKDDASPPDLHVNHLAIGVEVRPQIHSMSTVSREGLQEMTKACGTAYLPKVCGLDMFGYSCHATQEQWAEALSKAIDEKLRADTVALTEVMQKAGISPDEIEAALSGVIEHDRPAIDRIEDLRHVAVKGETVPLPVPAADAERVARNLGGEVVTIQRGGEQ